MPGREQDPIMNLRTITVFFWACLVGTAAVAGDEQRTRIEIAVEDDVSGQQTFHFDSREAGFDLHGMAVGETRTVTDRSGKTADIRRTNDGFEFDVNGETIDLKELHELNGMHGEHEIEMHIGDADSDVTVVKDVRKVKMISTGSGDGVTVISGREIDEATRERIREALRSAGQDDEVQFIDGREFDADVDTQTHGNHEVRVIRKEVDVTN